MRSNLRSMTFLAVLAIAGCTSGSSSTEGGAGSVAVGLTLVGNPPKFAVDLTNVAHADVTLKAIDLHIVPADASGPADENADDDGASWRTVTLPAETHFDLMTLQSGVVSSLGRLTALPAGRITQIRLVLDKEGPHGVVLGDGEKCTLDLSHVPETGIRIVHPFAAIDFDGHTPIQIVLDLDVVSSLRQVAPCAYVLDPVIRVDHVDAEADSDGNSGPTEDTDEQGQEGEH